jgi:hypothetical protein
VIGARTNTKRIKNLCEKIIHINVRRTTKKHKEGNMTNTKKITMQMQEGQHQCKRETSTM